MLLGFAGIIAGFFIAFDHFVKWEPKIEKARSLIEKNKKFIGIGAAFIGLWKFFGPDATEVIDYYTAKSMAPTYSFQPFIGDLIPALLLFLGGFCLAPEMLNFFNITDESKEKVKSTMDKIKVFLGLGNIVIGLIHLLVGQTVLF
ncbi:MAG TPA: hypothetical protein DHW82_09940 [Spirochaetia bacterium]|nr:MAG: hypothetical protein A2Y41_06310 [Spirochaetes bacterium GWB1_36_13]HCL57312.1 hypothetical protein [Spirochaetia bacterium]